MHVGTGVEVEFVVVLTTLCMQIVPRVNQIRLQFFRCDLYSESKENEGVAILRVYAVCSFVYRALLLH